MRPLRSVTLKTLVVLLLLGLLSPAVVYLTSPWWAPGACRWAADRYWGAKLDFATATLNPFELSLEGAGGTFRAPPAKGFQAEGDLSRVRLNADLLPLLREGRVREASLELATLSVTVAEGGGMLPLSAPDRGVPPLDPASLVQAGGEAGGRPWMIDRLTLRVDRGVLRYRKGVKRGEVTMDLGFKATYRDVRSLDDVTRKVVQDILDKAAYSFLTERIFR